MVAHALQERVSDHFPIVITTLHHDAKKSRDFKYYNMWNSHPFYKSIVRGCWEMRVIGCHMFQIIRKLKVLKHRLRALHKKYFSNIIEEVRITREKL